MTRNRLLAFTLALTALVGAAWLLWPSGSRDARPPAMAATAGQEREVLYWYDPMRPEVHFDKPGKSPFMDMQLVPKYADEDEADVIEVDPRIVQSFGLRTAPVTRSSLASRIDAVGIVEVDERRTYAIEARAAGWIEQLEARAVGDPVRRGQRVAGVYSPELYAAQQELALAMKAGDEALRAAARERLVLLGVPDAQIQQVASTGQAQRRSAVIAPSNGIVTEINVREGEQVAASQPLMRIADLSKVWITIELPEAQAGAVRAGQRVRARLRAAPGEALEGTLEYVYPRLQPSTRTVSARFALDNPELRLKPGMYADVTLLGEAAVERLVVPTEAVIRTGRRTVVIVAEGEGRFRPVPVQLGPESEDEIVILEGLEAGQQVVVSGQFLIDSEASLRGLFNRLEAQPAPPAEHSGDHGTHAPTAGDLPGGRRP